MVQRRGDGLVRYTDLPDVLDAARLRPGEAGEEWRIHFHVPVFAGQLGPFRSTQPLLRDLLAREAASDIPLPTEPRPADEAAREIIQRLGEFDINGVSVGSESWRLRPTCCWRAGSSGEAGRARAATPRQRRPGLRSMTVSLWFREAAPPRL